VDTAAVLDDHEHMEAAQVDRVDMREVDSEGGVGLRGQELAPGRSQPLRGGLDARGLVGSRRIRTAKTARSVHSSRDLG
jgi:hypothetical protein